MTLSRSTHSTLGTYRGSSLATQRPVWRLVTGVTLALTVLGLLAAPTNSFAQRPDRGGPRGGGGPMGPPRDFLKSLGLSPQQNKQLQALMDAGRKEASDLRSQMDDSHRALADVLRSYSLDRDRANKLIREINRTQLRLLQARLKTQSEMRRILTADQWDRLQKGWQEAALRRGTGPGPRGSRPGMPPGGHP